MSKIKVLRTCESTSSINRQRPIKIRAKYILWVANPQDTSIFSKAAEKSQSHEGKIDDSERLRSMELNQQGKSRLYMLKVIWKMFMFQRRRGMFMELLAGLILLDA
ncbi:hypothetical protein MKW98_009351 [Papaver atlanticum]|uniref:Uncharacterized protein n=1 Tax=Papaver atlanticum TaxID=357466 RepID=A0AAD4RZ89_9MAGN|nr:hypothetical protein MKW98_009351 [Papaver atlanticum]